MQIGISLDTDQLYKVYCIDDNNLSSIQHIQFYLNNEPLNIQKESIFQFQHKFSDYGFTYSVHSYGYINLCDPIENIRNEWIKYSRQTLDLTKEIGGIFTNFHMGYLLSESIKREDAINNLKSSISILSKYAFKNNVQINLENDFNTKGIYRIGSCIDDLNIIKQICFKNVHLCYDIGHANIAFKNPYVYRNILENIQSFHIHNNYGYNDSHFPYGNNGTIDLDMIFRELIDYEKIYFILENELVDYNIALKNLNQIKSMIKP